MSVSMPPLATTNTTIKSRALFILSSFPQKGWIWTSPPFGGKESKEAQTNLAYKTSAIALA